METILVEIFITLCDFAGKMVKYDPNFLSQNPLFSSFSRLSSCALIQSIKGSKMKILFCSDGKRHKTLHKAH